MTGPLRVAAAQAESVSGDVEANVATAVSLVDSAARNGARLVVLPELFLTGYDPDRWGPDAAVTPEDPLLQPLRDAARDRAVVVVAGAAVRRAADRHTLSLLVLDADGGLTAPYDKQHLFQAERGFFTPGDHGATIRLDGWAIGLGICYDGCFPEHATAAASDGATAYLCPSAYYVGSEHRRDLYYAARALDNGIYVVYSGLAGKCGSYAFNGGSAVYGPEGRPVDRVGDEVPAIAYADLDPAEVARVREMNPIGRDRVAGLGKRHHHELTG
ncbi:MAG TPA: carbon-nitrogen hydrolase family protein [Nocardioidaceae bacterium]|nr:carbon-nitrogen hydrolase family protein [Nocardioidaceae bacterium]